MTSLTAELAAHLVAVRYDALPPTAIAAAKKLMLDTLAVAWAGTAASGASAALTVARRQDSPAESTLWAHGGRVAAESAAFANAVFASALDFDAHYFGVHTDGVVLPAAIAVAERQRSSGVDFLTALVAATDVVCRLARSARGAHRGWYYTSIFGVAGAAAATAKLLALDANSTRHALGIALAQASGTQQPAVERTLAMRFQSAFAARAGVVAGLLAAAGITAPAEALEGRFGLFSLYQPGDAESVMRELGRAYYNDQVAFKKYPCCACSHAAIEAARAITSGRAIAVEEIERVVVRISAEMDRLVGERSAPDEDPEVAAQFNVAYAVTCTLLSGTFSVRHLQPAFRSSDEVRALAQRVSVVVDPSLQGKFAPAEVEVVLRERKPLRSRIDVMPGTPDAPLGDAAFAAKLAECFASGAKPLDARRSAALQETVSRLELLPGLHNLFENVFATTA